MARTRAVARRCTGGVHEGKVKQNARSPVKSLPQSPETDHRQVSAEPENRDNVSEANAIQSNVATSVQNEKIVKDTKITLDTDDAKEISEDETDSDVEAMAKAAATDMNIFYSDDSSSEDDDSDIEDKSEDNNEEAGSLFVIDKAPGARKATEIYKANADLDGRKSSKEKASLTKKEKQKIKVRGTVDDIKLASELECNIDTSDIYVNTDTYKKPEKQSKSLTDILLKSDKNKDIMAKSVVQPDFEKRDSTPVYSESRNQLVKARRAEREKSKGSNWFNMPATEMTEELKNDLTVLQMRKVLDPKRFYKGNDTRSLPKYFQMGTVVESSADFYHSRIAKKDRKATMVDELLADAEFRKYNKRKYAELQEATHRSKGAFKHAKRLKKKKK